MQQQLSQQEQQYGNHQMSQPMVLCPVQYVYETPMLVQPEEQIQQPQPYLLNVQNPPPWIQNRPQNQVVYVQQMASNIQPYMHHNMIQNPMYQQQINYQIPQMLVPQEIRPVMQIANLQHYNTVQNPRTEETDKMPLLTQMLNQKMNAQINARPVMQNQQVQTDISTGYKGRPRGPRPQVITINPMQQRPMAPQGDFIINIRQPNATDVPTHIRNKIPSSISVKTVYRHILPRPIRPNEVAPQNYHYNPNFNNYIIPENVKTVNDTNINIQQMIASDKLMNVPVYNNLKNEMQTMQKVIAEVSGEVKNVVNNQRISHGVSSETQTEEKMIRNTVFVQARGRVLNEKETVPNLKRPLDERLENNLETTEIPAKYVKLETPYSNLLPNSANYVPPNVNLNTPPIIATTTSQIIKSESKNNEIKSKLDRLPDLNPILPKTEDLQQRIEPYGSNNKVESAKSETEGLKKKVQFSDHVEVENINYATNLNKTAELCDSKNKMEVTNDKSKQSKEKVESSSNQDKIEEIKNRIKDLKEKVFFSDSNNKIEGNKERTEDLKEKNTLSNTDFTNVDIKSVLKKNLTKNLREKTKLNKITKDEIQADEQKTDENSKIKLKTDTKISKDEIKTVADVSKNEIRSVQDKDNKEKDNKLNHKIVVLTHVLDGHIIQESNVAFPIQKPSKDGDQKKSCYTKAANLLEMKHEVVPLLPLSYQHLTKDIETDEEKLDRRENDHPFMHIKKTDVRSWTTDQLAEHLSKHHWTETASKLQEQEIDGESFLMVNKDQLMIVGVNEDHADIINDFVNNS